MIEESPMSETLILFVVNAVLSMLCSQLHKCLYFLLNLTYWAMHFGHYFLTFLVLYVLFWLGYTPKEPRLTLSQLWPLVLTETILSVATCVVHTGGSDGAVHSIRVTDFAVTLLVIFAARFFIEEAYYSAAKSKYTLLLVVIAISSSIAWMEPIMFFNLKTIVVWPLIVLSTSFHFMLTFQIAQKTKVHPLTLTRQICGLTSILVCPLALIFTSDSFNSETQDVTSAWELIDYKMK
uniref:Uncharacterized protein n=1 Tax=Romanomermis culicivorax TaxID=13658 RepID=A0A915HYM4_ROMCU